MYHEAYVSIPVLQVKDKTPDVWSDLQRAAKHVVEPGLESQSSRVPACSFERQPPELHFGFAPRVREMSWRKYSVVRAQEL